MPTYLDEKCILYLFLKAHIILKIKYLEKKINEAKEFFRKKGLIQNKGKREIQNLKAVKALNFIKEKFFSKNSEIIKEKTTNIENEKDQLNSTSINKKRASMFNIQETKKKISRASSMSSSMFLNISNNNYFNINEESNENLNHLKLKYIKKLSLNKNIKINFEEYITFSEEIEKLKKLKEILKAEEMKRIFEEFHRNKYLQRYKVEKDVVLSALIGEENIFNETFIQNKREKFLSDEIIKTRLYKKNYHARNSTLMNNRFRLIKKNDNFIMENENLKSIYNINFDYINDKK